VVFTKSRLNKIFYEPSLDLGASVYYYRIWAWYIAGLRGLYRRIPEMTSGMMAPPKRKASKPKRQASYVMVNMKVSEEYKEWLDGLAKHCRTDASKLLDRGLILVAKEAGYDKEVPER
jgi:hypothetical protein